MTLKSAVNFFVFQYIKPEKDCQGSQVQIFKSLLIIGERNSKTSIVICYAQLLHRPRKVYFIYINTGNIIITKQPQAFSRFSYHCYICNLNPQMQVFAVAYSRPENFWSWKNSVCAVPKPVVCYQRYERNFSGPST